MRESFLIAKLVLLGEGLILSETNTPLSESASRGPIRTSSKLILPLIKLGVTSMTSTLIFFSDSSSSTIKSLLILLDRIELRIAPPETTIMKITMAHFMIFLRKFISFCKSHFIIRSRQLNGPSTLGWRFLQLFGDG